MPNEIKTVEQICEEMRNDWAQLYFANGTHKRNGEYSDVAVIETDKVADQIDAAHNRELSKKDAEIASLRALVKEMADKLQSDYCCNYETLFDGCDITDICPNADTCALVVKARGVCK